MPEPTIDGPELFARLEETMKDFAHGTNISTNNMLLLLETMHKSGDIFRDFSNDVERSGVIMKSFGRALSDVSQGLRGAVSSVEGFMSAMSTLGNRTADITKSIIMHIGAKEMEIAKYKDQKVALENNIKLEEDLIKQIQKRLKDEKEGKGLAMSDAQRNADIASLNQHENAAKNLRLAHLDLTEKLEKTTIATKAFSAVLTKTFAWVTIIATAVVGLAAAYEASIKTKREVLYMLGRLGAGYSENIAAMDKFNVSFTSIASRWGMLREEMAKAVAPLTALGVGVGAGGITEALKTGMAEKTLTTAADWTGAMMRGFGVEVGITSRALGTLSTAMNINGEVLGDTFGRLAAMGEKSVLGMQRYISETISMLEITRKYGGSIEGVELLINAFGTQLKSGIIGMEALARLAAPAMWSPEQKGAMVSLMQQFAPTEAGKLGLTGKDLMTGMMALEKSAKDIEKGGNPEVLLSGLRKVIDRLVPAGASEGERAFMMQQLLQQLTGAQISTLEAMEAFTDPDRFAKMLKPPAGKKTPEEMLDSAIETFRKVITPTEALAPAVEEIRNVMSRTVGPVMEKIGGFFGVKTSKELEAERQKDYMLSGKYMEEPGYREDLLRRYRHMKAHPEEEIARRAQYDVGGIEMGVNVSQGYIPELPKTGGVKSVNVKMGDINVSTSGINAQALEAVLKEQSDKIIKQTVGEVERQWEQSLHAH